MFAQSRIVREASPSERASAGGSRRWENPARAPTQLGWNNVRGEGQGIWMMEGEVAGWRGFIERALKESDSAEDGSAGRPSAATERDQ